ncbi:hypothetical protein HOP52_02175 [Halomonas campisalis]|uniref:Uncharacterized protein n=1 Tax=Billgrantia campisalis TaxID=74661 RepID=A0ABS9P471_9GAMM|nr:hypothetical protein [Halomonas campisalis]MCG6656583.1 hypothetical protein [Halomonas campisalis]MDR5861769.1 hypothetical protein [Halomonas campisalis]
MRGHSAVTLLTATLILTGCAAAPPQPDPVRQALLNLSERAAGRVMNVAELQPPADQVLLLATPEMDGDLGIDSKRFLENLTRALLGVTPGPQVLDWRPTMAGDVDTQHWRLVSQLDASAPRLRLSDRDLLPYRLTLALYRADAESPLWRTEIEGAFDATAL